MYINEQFGPAEIASWVNVDAATASRRIFSDEAIFQLEIERIFGNAWLYIGHESEIPAVGDFVTRLMGKDPVILVRVTENEIAVLLNSCPHRGAMLCQADAGNGKGLICPYHGWAFSNAGRLVATSTDDGLYADRVDFRTLDLRSAAKVSSYAGLIYATWNADAPSLDDYLGDIRWAIDLCFNRTPGGVEVLGAP
ncbi:MAG: aromatic ring-hydroxylating dioxygenase subunit alpha, partial [Gammaproteobacteria bacterium]